MATYTIKAPDGNSYTLDGPDNASQEAIQTEVLRQHPTAADAPKAAVAEPDILDAVKDYAKGQVGGLEEAGHLVSSGVGSAAGGVAGLLALAGNKIAGDIPGVTKEPFDPAGIVGHVSDALTYEPRTEQGKHAQAIVNKPLQALASGADKAGEYVSDKTGSPALGTIVNTAIQAAPMAIDPAIKGLRTGAPRPIEAEPVATAPTRDMTPQQVRDANIATLHASDVPTSAAQRDIGMVGKQTGSLARAADTVFGPSPLTERQGGAFTRQVAEHLGVDADRLTPDAMQELSDNTHQTYNRLLQQPTRVDPQLIADTHTIEQGVLSELGPNEAAPILRQLETIRAKERPGAPPDIDGTAAQASRAALGRMQVSGNPSVGHWAGELKDALDDAYERSAPPDDATQMREVRRVVRATKQVEPAIGPDGIVSPAKLYSQVNRKANRPQSLYGRGDQRLVDLARAGKDVLPEKLGNSGTATRGVDVMKVVQTLTHPLRTMAEGAAVGAGRLLNQAGADHGTISAVRARNAQASAANAAAQAPMAPGRAMANVLGAGAAVPSLTETDQQRKIRAMVDALRNQQ